MTIIQRSFALATAFAIMAISASAATVTCVGTGRSFSIDTTPVSTCAAVSAPGDHNISGNSMGANPDPLFALLGPGLILLDKSDDTSSGTNPTALSGTGGLITGTAGSFSFDISSLVASVGKEYYNFVLAFKSGGNFKTQSTWAAFGLANGVSNGTWSFTGQNGLSHANLYAYERNVTPPPSPVPLPASGALLLIGIAGLAAMRSKAKSI